MRQFEIWWAKLPKPAGRRPVLLLTRDDAYSYLNKFVAAEITTTIRDIPVEVPLGRREGWANPASRISIISEQILSSLTQQMQHDVPSMPRPTVLEDINPLPGSQRRPSIDHWNR